MSKNPIQQLHDFGQSPWYDNISRGLIRSGGLQKLIDDGVRGVTANPTIFEKAVNEGNDYDDEIRDLSLAGKSSEEIYERLITDDIRAAADVLRPLYDASSAHDGYISIEVSPRLAHQTPETVAEAQRFHKTIDRPNMMIKVPATSEGIPAVENLIGQGINVNVTLIFSLDAYRQVCDAYIAGLEKLATAGKPLDRVASVASFFVSRVDTAVDKRLQVLIDGTTDTAKKAELTALQGKAAIANARLAYQIYREIFEGERFAALAAKGAQPQRCLWASTGTKDPRYSDVLYVEELIGRNTVDTIPPATLAAWKDHGVPRLSIENDLDGAKATLTTLATLGISIDQVTAQLLIDGVKVFADAFDKLDTSIVKKRDDVLAAPAR